MVFGFAPIQGDLLPGPIRTKCDGFLIWGEHKMGHNRRAGWWANARRSEVRKWQPSNRL